MSDLRPISNIKIGIRHRRDLGDVSMLAHSIAEIGLLHPVVVRPDGTFIAGERRLRAAELLGWTEIPVTVVDLAAVVAGEFAENAERKDFTLSESVAIRRALEPIERAAAKERRGGDHKGNPGKFPTLNGRALDKVAKVVGRDRTTIAKAEAIVDAVEAEPEKYGKLLADMDRTGRVNGVFKRLKVARQAEQYPRRAAAASGPRPLSGYRQPTRRGRTKSRVADPSHRSAYAISPNVHRRNLRAPGCGRRRSGCRFMAVDHEPAHARGVRGARCMGFPAEDNSDVGKSSNGQWRLAPWPN